MPNTPSPSADAHLLRAWAQGRDQGAFRGLVEKYTGLVYGTALRRSGRSDWAEYVVQEVFIVFARRAPQLKGAGELAGWLHQTALNKTLHRMRAESRHDHRMKKLAAQVSETHAPEPSGEEWAAIRPVLDEAIASLGEQDRQVILCHYFQQKTFAEVAGLTGLTPEAARKRAQRVLVKLGDKLRRKTGRPVEAAVAGLLTIAGTQAAPAGLAAKTSAAALAAAAAGAATVAATPGVFSLIPLLTMKTSTIAFLVLPVATAGSLAWGFWPRETGKPRQLSALVRATAPVSLKTKRVPVAAAPHDPRRAGLPSPAKSPPGTVTERDFPDSQYAEAFKNHPRTKLAEKRLDAFKEGARTLLKRRLQHPELLDQYNEVFARSRDTALCAAERAAAELELADIKARQDEDRRASGLEEFYDEWSGWMQGEVMAERKAILAEVKRTWGQAPESAAPGTPPPNQTETAAEPLPPDAPWHQLLDAMIAGDHAAAGSASAGLLRDTPSAGCFAMAANAISRGQWDDAQIWIDQAWKHGTPEENTAFAEALANLGWMQPDLKQLIPPEAEPAPESGIAATLQAVNPAPHP